jgi:hypothetical protein
MNDHSPSEAWKAFRRVYWSLAALLAIILLLLWLMGYGPGGRKCEMPRSAVMQHDPQLALQPAQERSGGVCQLVVLRDAA